LVTTFTSLFTHLNPPLPKISEFSKIKTNNKNQNKQQKQQNEISRSKNTTFRTFFY